VVELTTVGLNPRPAGLRQIAEGSGLHVVAGCGWYRQVTAPPGLADGSETSLAESLQHTIETGFPGSGGIRPGIIGEIGTGDPLHPDEVKALRAAARAQQTTGLAIAVHLALWGRQGTAVMDVLERAGADPRRVLLCHLGEQPHAVDYHLTLLERGAALGFDTFGAEYALDSAGRRLATDEERIAGVRRLVDAGHAERLLLSHDICERLQLRAYGGFGYAHLLTTIRPRLYRAGLDAATLDLLLRQNPARLLTRGR
jgi:phosphotriesterase-related protein